jgi:hypothetical protein
MHVPLGTNSKSIFARALCAIPHPKGTPPKARSIQYESIYIERAAVYCSLCFNCHATIAPPPQQRESHLCTTYTVYLYCYVKIEIPRCWEREEAATPISFKGTTHPAPYHPLPPLLGPQNRHH